MREGVGYRNYVVFKKKNVQGVHLILCFFFKNSRKFATTPSTARGCYWLYKNYQPIGVTVHSHCVESFDGLLQQYKRGRGCSEL